MRRGRVGLEAPHKNRYENHNGHEFSRDDGNKRQARTRRGSPTSRVDTLDEVSDVVSSPRADGRRGMGENEGGARRSLQC